MRRSFYLLGSVCLGVTASLSLQAGNIWLGNNLDGTLPLLNTDLTGTTLRSAGVGTVIGIAINPSTGALYLNDGYGAVNRYDVRALSPGATFSAPGLWDLAFDGSSVWGSNPSGQSLDQYDVFTGDYLSSINLNFTPLGLAWDGVSFLVSEDAAGGAVHRILGDGMDSLLFVPFAGDTPGGLAWDPGTASLWIGSSSTVSNFKADGTLVSSFSLSDGRFVDGLEFQQTPEPATFALTGIATGLLLLKRYRRKGL